MSFEKKTVDWEWANRLPMLPIFEATALSLGYELGSLPPVGWEYQGKPQIDVPEHGQRTFLAYEYARAGKLRLVGLTNFRGDIFDSNAEFSYGQAWEVELQEFRQFCDRMGWEVPKEFVPIGYRADTPIPNANDAMLGATLSVPNQQMLQRRRGNLLAPLIEQAQLKVTNQFNANEIWAVLCDMAKNKTSPLIGQTEQGLQWLSANDTTEYLSLKALRGRLIRQKKQ